MADPKEILSALLADPEAASLLDTTILDAILRRAFGRDYDSFNIDKLAFLAAGIDSSQYAVARMARARRFGTKLQLLDHAAKLAPASGLVLEFGVYSGNTLNHLARRFPARTVHGFDSFQGLPETWRPGFGAGKFSRPDLPPVAENADLVVGWFDRSLPDFKAAHPDAAVALLHVDCDLYSSTQTIFAQLADRIKPGTIIVFDEYFNYPEWRQHEFRAFQEFVAARRVHYDYIGLVPSSQQVAVRIVGLG